MNAEAALNALKEGNQRFVEENSSYPRRDHGRRAESTRGQSPFAIVLSCADSRVMPEAAFDQGIGDLFVVRVAGNVANTSSIASIEYAVAHLGTELIVVLGHESCGAVTAALAGGDNGYNLNHLLSHVEPAKSSANSSDVNTVVKENARKNCEALSGRSSIISEAVRNGKLSIVPAYYHLGSGQVEFLQS
jgi:carbonic anhydrase